MKIDEMERVAEELVENIGVVDGGDEKKCVDLLLKLFSSAQRDKSPLETRLSILHEYQEKYLKLLREYKEEIKFACSTQEDIRRERSAFFTQILNDASEALSKASIPNAVASQWVQYLIDSYTKSLDACADAVKAEVLDPIMLIRQQSLQEIAKSDQIEVGDFEKEIK